MGSLTWSMHLACSFFSADVGEYLPCAGCSTRHLRNMFWAFCISYDTNVMLNFKMFLSCKCSLSNIRITIYLFIYLFIFIFSLSRATPTAYGGSQARGCIRAVAAGLYHSHSIVGSELHLQPTPQLAATPDS